MALPDLTGQFIQDTYQRVLQVSGSGNITDGTGSLFIPNSAISSSYAQTASFVDTSNLATTGSNSFTGTQRVLFTTCSIIYSGSNITQITQSYQGGTQQITDILYSGSFEDGNPLSIAITGSDGINKLYSFQYSSSLITQITVT